MKVKKYVAASMPEAMKVIRSDLGKDAVILNSKIVYTGGIFGFFRKKNIEVIAAVDQVAKIEPKIKEKPKKAVPILPNHHVVEQKALQKDSAGNPSFVEKPSEEVLKELSEMKEMIKKLSKLGQERISYPEPIQKVHDVLLEQEIDKEIREEILILLLEKWYAEGSRASLKEVIGWCKEVMTSRISNYSFGEIAFTLKYVNVVGPTGVGKTTTLAKIAADCILKFNKKVAFITTDTYRIAAIDQLKTYAKILSIPLEVCYSLEDFQKACETYKDFDVVLIDTAGRNFRNEEYVKELEKVIHYNQEMETLLVLALTSKQRDMEAIYQQFSNIQINQFIFTKMDETANYGSMYNMIDKYKKGAAYITNGQNVPDDRVSATAEMITNMILGVEEE